MSEISSLTSQVQQLGQSVDFWGSAVNVLLALTAIVGVLYFGATIRQSTLAKRLRETQELLLQEKDRQLAIDLKSKDVEIEKAKGEAANAKDSAGKANERAAANEKEAARLNKVAEDERFARLKLAKTIAPRRLTGTQKETLTKLLSARPWGIVIVSVILDSESSDFADDFDAAISGAKWSTRRSPNHITERYGVELGTAAGQIPVELNAGFHAATNDIGHALDAIGIKYERVTFEGKELRTVSPYFEPGVLYLVINHKPQPQQQKDTNQ